MPKKKKKEKAAQNGLADEALATEMKALCLLQKSQFQYISACK